MCVNALQLHEGCRLGLTLMNDDACASLTLQLPCVHTAGCNTGEGGREGALLVHGDQHEADADAAPGQDREGAADRAAPPGPPA